MDCTFATSARPIPRRAGAETLDAHAPGGNARAARSERVGQVDVDAHDRNAAGARRWLASVYVFGEQVRRMHVAGIILITVGIACVPASD